ncbi:MAG: hypothetical protein NWE83_10940 [Candidatus Bathyarchaeota archaeon]|nr:hypothetical protein [Candidatus Bathyarchaeota archaeon]
MSESWDHLSGKWAIARMFQQLGFKVDVEVPLYLFGSKYIFDVIAIKNQAAIVIEVGLLQHRDISFDELYDVVKKRYSRFHVRHVTFSNPQMDQLDLQPLTPDDIPRIQREINSRKKPDDTLHIRD